VLVTIKYGHCEMNRNQASNIEAWAEEVRAIPRLEQALTLFQVLGDLTAILRTLTDSHHDDLDLI
jgi:hypothetical protein